MYAAFSQFLTPQGFLIVITILMTFITVALLLKPFFQNERLQSRMKAIGEERKQLRDRERAKLYASNAAQAKGIRQAPKSYIKKTVEKFDLQRAFDAESTRKLLMMAGYRGQGPLFTFLFFQLSMPFAFGLAALFYLFVLEGFGLEPFNRVSLSIAFAVIGFFMPKIMINNIIQKRQLSMRRAFPDALDLLLICIESGMSIEVALRKVSEEIGGQSVALAEEMALTTAELSYLQERRHAYENLSKRTGLKAARIFASTLIQAEKYGTPLGQALRTLAQENRTVAMQAAEKKAAALPPKLTVPMILFFLPVLFVVILGPAIISVLSTFE